MIRFFFFWSSWYYPKLKNCLKIYISGCPQEVRSGYQGFKNFYDFVCTEGKRGLYHQHSKFFHSSVICKKAKSLRREHKWKSSRMTKNFFLDISSIVSRNAMMSPINFLFLCILFSGDISLPKLQKKIENNAD